MRFPDKEAHQIFLEPEGLDVDEIYINGFSMSLPAEVQRAVVRALPGLADAELIRPGYAVEYDFVQPTSLHHTLEVKSIGGLYFAGQINGTSGYEEAAAQGWVAGVNAGLRATGRPPIVLGRHESYIGILVDDLVTRGCLEPYRMFTSRAEHRLRLRIDNADLRLTPVGRSLGTVSDERWARFETRRQRYATQHESLAVDAGAGWRPAIALPRPRRCATRPFDWPTWSKAEPALGLDLDPLTPIARYRQPGRRLPVRRLPAPRGAGSPAGTTLCVAAGARSLLVHRTSPDCRESCSNA